MSKSKSDWRFFAMGQMTRKRANLPPLLRLTLASILALGATQLLAQDPNAGGEKGGTVTKGEPQTPDAAPAKGQGKAKGGKAGAATGLRPGGPVFNPKRPVPAPPGDVL